MVLPDVPKYSDGQFSRATTDKSIIQFKGLNLMPVVSDGEFSAMSNLSARNYPCLSPRAKRSIVRTGLDPATEFTVVNGKMIWVDANNFYYDGVNKGALTLPYGNMSCRQLVPFQDKILIWPDAMAYDISAGTLISLAVSLQKPGLVFVASGSDPTRGAVKYSSITATTVFTDLKAGDSISVASCATVQTNNIYAVIDHISDDGKILYFPENVFLNGTESGTVYVERRIPQMEYICVANNRVWGCNRNSIYASKLGSAENWFNFAGLSTDSFAVDVSTEGDFNGCHAFGSCVAFFKENYIHKLIGTKPKNYQLSTVTCPGLGMGGQCHSSLAYASGVLYYKTPTGIAAFTGGVPTLISDKLGNLYGISRAETDGRYYYVSLYKESGNYKLFVYDTRYNVWHVEESNFPLGFGNFYGHIRMLAGGQIVEFDSPADNEMVTWSGILGEFTEFAAEKKIHSKIRMRVELPGTSTLKIEYSADGRDWITAWTGSGAMRSSFFVSIIPTRCDSFRLRLSGVGDCTIYQIDRVFSYGTDMR